MLPGKAASTEVMYGLIKRNAEMMFTGSLIRPTEFPNKGVKKIRVHTLRSHIFTSCYYTENYDPNEDFCLTQDSVHCNQKQRSVTYPYEMIYRQGVLHSFGYTVTSYLPLSIRLTTATTKHRYIYLLRPSKQLVINIKFVTKK